MRVSNQQLSKLCYQLAGAHDDEMPTSLRQFLNSVAHTAPSDKARRCAYNIRPRYYIRNILVWESAHGQYHLAEKWQKLFSILKASQRH